MLCNVSLGISSAVIFSFINTLVSKVNIKILKLNNTFFISVLLFDIFFKWNVVVYKTRTFIVYVLPFIFKYEGSNSYEVLFIYYKNIG